MLFSFFLHSAIYVSGIKRFPEAQDQGSHKQFILFSPSRFTFVAFSSKRVWKFDNCIAEEGKNAPTSNVSKKQLEFKLHYTSAIDLGAAGIWSGKINAVKAMKGKTIDTQ